MIQKLKPLHLACGNDEDKPNHFLIGIRNNIATACNGSLMVKADLTLTSQLGAADLKILNGKFIHKAVWKEIFKCDELEIEAKQIHCEKDGITKTFYYDKAQGEGQESFFGRDPVQDVKEAGEESKRIICFSPSQIDIVHNIFQTDIMNFSFSPKGLATVLFPSVDSGMFAILMPEEQLELNRYLFLD